MYKTTKSSKKKFLLGLSLSLVLAMAIGSFAIGEAQTPVTPQAAEPEPVKAGDFLLSTAEGSEITDQDYTFDEQAGILTIISDKDIVIQNEDPEAPTTNRIVVNMSGKWAAIILDGVNINTPNGPALDIVNVNERLDIYVEGDKTNHETILKSTNSSSAGLQKNVSGVVSIVPSKNLTAIGGENGAGIGGGDGCNTSNITLCGVGGSITAIGGNQGGAGIGGGKGGTGSQISIVIGTVIATGGDGAAGIGGGKDATGSSDNVLFGAVVKATSGGASIEALDGFLSSDDGSSLLDDGIAFTRKTESGSWQGSLYYKNASDIEIVASVEFPVDITIPSGITLMNNSAITLANGVKLTIDDGATLYNISGTIPDDDTVICNGTITTDMMFYREGEDDPYDEMRNVPYKTAGQVQNYSGLPNPDDPELNATNDETSFDGWYTQPNGKGTKIENGNPVLVNEHNFYEHRTEEKHPIKIDQPENGRIVLDKDEAAEGDEVGFTLIPNDGYELKEGSVKVTDEDGKEIQVTEKDGKYTFTMPAASVTVSAVFELIPTPTPPTPTPPTPTPSVIVPVQPDNGNIEVLTQDPEPGDTVIFMVTPNEGYQVKGLPTVQILRQSFIARLFGNNIGIDVQSLGDNKYSFVMPNDNVAISAVFELIPTPTPPGPEPGPTPEPTPDPSVDPDGDGGSGSSSKTSDPFMGGIALALLGVATTGAVLVRKRK